ncbi:WXG100 family type VII secretion target [Timonella sp. A28]|uniref:WXG100 family type VII secretion target n=1 Tax=Timonella sp. A28 TaxID=3442640 RepID=UPI003EBEB010
MSVFAVDTNQVEQASANVRRSVDSIRAEVAAMMSHLTNLQGTWKGEAAIQFQELSGTWHTTQTQVEASLESINRALDATAATYLDAEANVRGFFRS